MHVLVTRPTQDAEPLLARLRERGIEATAEPLLEIAFKTDARVNLKDVQAVLATSANGVRAFARISDRRDLPLYAVGDATAAAAAEAGFETVESAKGDVADLAALAADKLDPGAGALLHAAPTQMAGDLGGDLKARGFVYRRAVLYEAKPAVHLSDETIAAVRDGRINGVLLFSPRTADVFVSLARKARIVRSCRRMTAFCMSAAVAERVRAVTWQEIAVAGSPDQDSLLALIGIPSLGPWSDMTRPPETEPEKETVAEDVATEEGETPAESAVETEPEPEPEPQPESGPEPEPQPEPEPEPQPSAAPAPARTVSRRSVVPAVILWTLLVLAFVGGAVYAAYPFWSPYLDAYVQAMQQDPFADPRMDSLSKRLSVLESATQTPDDALKELEQERAEMSEKVGRLVDRVNSLEGSLDSVRKMIEATNLPLQAADARKSLEELSQRLTQIEASGGVESLRENLQALDAENNRLSSSVDDLSSRLQNLAEKQSARAQAAAVQVQASIIEAGQLREALRSAAPFAEELAEFRKAVEGDAELTALADKLAPYAGTGIPILATLREQFDGVARDVAKAIRRMEGEGWVAGMVNRLASLVSVRRTEFAEDDDSPDAVLARADAAMLKGDLPAAVAALGNLTGAPAAAAAGWLERARARIAAEQAMAALHVHAVSAMSPTTK